MVQKIGHPTLDRERFNMLLIHVVDEQLIVVTDTTPTLYDLQDA
jgi:hypothetical protein